MEVLMSSGGLALLKVTGLLAVLAARTAAGGEIPTKLDAALMGRYARLGPDLAAAGRPSAAALDKLGEWGFKTVVNLRTAEEEGVTEEAAAVKAGGLRYVSVPVTPETFSLADVVQVEKVLADPGATPVLLHCASSNRVGAVWAAIQFRKGRPFEQAEAEGVAAGLSSPAMRQALRRVLGLPPASPAP
jgi:uncharacterized protein (TIGR01244 family)